MRLLDYDSPLSWVGTVQAGVDPDLDEENEESKEDDAEAQELARARDWHPPTEARDPSQWPMLLPRTTLPLISAYPILGEVPRPLPTITSILFPSEPQISATDVLDDTGHRGGADRGLVEGMASLDMGGSGTEQDPDVVASATPKTEVEERPLASDTESEDLASLQIIMGLAQALDRNSRKYLQFRHWVRERAMQWSDPNHRAQAEIGFMATANARSITRPDDRNAAAQRIASTWTTLDRWLSEYEEANNELDDDTDTR